jgi:hypothetical protein
MQGAATAPTRGVVHPDIPELIFELPDHDAMTELWTFLAADDEPTARARALTLAGDLDHDAEGTTGEAIEFEPGRWRVKVALQRTPIE